MDHVDLKPHPFPEGIAIPRLMPFQEYPWNGDGYLAAEVLRLKKAHGLACALETGTCLGSTTIWLSKWFDDVVTCEIHQPYLAIARSRVTSDRVKFRPGSSVGCIPDAQAWFGPRSAFMFLDAHWGAHCPLLDELDAIASPEPHYGMGKPCILIHDFQVPGTDFGFDKMPDGRPFNLDLIRDHLDRIYGEDGWKHNYPTKVEGARRGWISIEPAKP